MLFTSPLFLFFFVAVLALFHVFRLIDERRAPSALQTGDTVRHPLSQAFLLAASLVFYAGWEFPRGLWFLPLLLGTILIDWHVGGRLFVLPQSRHRARLALLLLSLTLNLGVLTVFKYLGFFSTVLNGLSELAGGNWQIAVPRLILPLGISFFTFQSMSYTIDAYRRRGRPFRSAFDFLFCVTFFPHLIAGPILRAEQFRSSLLSRRDCGVSALAEGLKVCAVGLFLKVVLGDSTAVRVDRLYEQMSSLTPLDALAAYYGFGLQIFCDFAGYSLIAIGMARCFGCRLPRNFDMPYLAVGLRDFWRRWHITLSTWLRDYLYIPLGGSKHGVARTACALALTMLLGGLWHGANWNFVIWGGAHGALLAAGRLMRAGVPRVAEWQETSGLGRAVTWFFTLHIVLLLWIPFRAPTLAASTQMLGLLAGVPSALAAALHTGVGAAMHREALMVVPFLAVFLVYHLAAIAGWRWIPKRLVQHGTVPEAGWSANVHGRQYLLAEDAILGLRPVPAGLVLGGLLVLAGVFHIGGVSFIYFAF